MILEMSTLRRFSIRITLQTIIESAGDPTPFNRGMPHELGVQSEGGDLWCAVQLSVLQMPLSVMALAAYIRLTACNAPLSATQPPSNQPFCSAPVVLAAVILLVEVRRRQ